jgi:hypothetical protein
MGKRFLGPEELSAIAKDVGISAPATRIAQVPAILFPESELIERSGDYLLILGVDRNAQGKPLTLTVMREFFGTDPDIYHPCFYNQDWYLKEHFAAEVVLAPRWYMIRTSVLPLSRAKDPETIKIPGLSGQPFPPAVLSAYAFFTNFFLSKGQILWENDFLWCADFDHNGDRIYVGRYTDPSGINKSGFNVHRHLRIRECYGVADACQG